MTTALVIGIVSIIILVVLVLLGVHIGISLGVVSFMGVLFLSKFKFSVALSILSSTAFSAVREYSFAVLPLFIMMGVLMSKSGAAKSLFTFCNFFLRKISGGLGIATVAANAIFAAVTGVSVASAAVFSKVALPEMIRYRYNKSFAIGAVVGSSVLGMLIPPSVLMILYGMLSGASIGKLFIAGFVPGLLLAAMYSIYIFIRAKINPALIGKVKNDEGKYVAIDQAGEGKENIKAILLEPLPIIILIVFVLGGIWGGLFTATEAAAVGALGATLIGLGKGMRLQEFKEMFLETASSTASIMMLLIMATMYGKLLSMSGLVNWLGRTVVAWDLSAVALTGLFCVILILLGCILDSSSIMLLTVPLMAPIITAMGFDIIWFGIIMIVAVETGLLTPPFGMCVFAVKAAVGNMMTVEEIFAGAMPYLIIMLLFLTILILCPPIVTWLVNMM